MLGIINVAQGTFYMLGAFGSWMLLNYAGIGYWPALILSPLIAGVVGMVLEKTLIARVYKLDHIYGLLLTYGLMMFIQGMFVYWFATAGRPYPVPLELRGGFDLGFLFLPKYRGWVVVASVVSSALRPGSRSRRPRSAARCAPRPKIRSSRAPSASTCRRC